MATPDTIFQTMRMLVVAYPDAKLEPETPKLYEKALADIPDDVLQAATLDHISRSPWFPKVSDLRKAATHIITDKLNQPTSGEAWGEFLRQAVSVGHSGTPTWSHPLIEQTVNALGWVDLCMSENQVADRARFMDTYDQLARRYVDQVQTLPQIAALAAKMSALPLPPKQIEDTVE